MNSKQGAGSETDFYEILQVSRNASLDVIKAAYRRLAMLHHPDVSGNDEAMTRINRAYEILSNEDSRSAYNRYLQYIESMGNAESPITATTESRSAPTSTSSPQWNSPSSSHTSRAMLLFRQYAVQFAVFVVVVVLLGVANVQNNSGTSSSSTTPKSPSSSSSNQAEAYKLWNELEQSNPALIQPALPTPFTGITYDNISEESLCPNKITTRAGEGDYLIKLYNSAGTLVMAMFIRNGDSLEFDLPPGNYTLKYACGWKWYGEKYYFGDVTEYGAATDKLVCYIDGDYAYGHDITLYPVYGGNMDTKTINKDAFEKGN